MHDKKESPHIIDPNRKHQFFEKMVRGRLWLSLYPPVAFCQPMFQTLCICITLFISLLVLTN